MKLTWPGFIGLLAALTLLSACGTSSSYNEGVERDPTAGSPGGVPVPSTPSDSGAMPAPGEGSDPQEGTGQTPTAGQLTAGDWDDNLNFTFFQQYLAQPPAGLPPYPSADRVLLTVRDDEGSLVSNARVTISGSAGTRLEAPTSAEGRLVFLPTQDGAREGESFTVTVAPPLPRTGDPVTVAVEGHDWNVTLPGVQGERPSALDVAFVVDTTGSMGDELSYLKAEVQGLVDAVHTNYPQVSARFALVLYRDESDAYVVRSYDFTSDGGTFQKWLQAQQADGGGDLPEAMEKGLGAIHQLSWRPGNTVRLTFLVADAPTHPENHAAFLTEVRRARLGGIKVYPVAASGVTDEAEYQMRLAAQLTLGRYIFLTDDSGIGDPHALPHIPCYQVQLLTRVLARAIGSELEGRRLPASGGDVLRTVGNPNQEGACTLSDGTVTHLGSSRTAD